MGLPLRLLVRRILSISLLLLFSLLLISPLFAADAAGTNLPACCRKNGKHHCMMQNEASVGDALHAAAVREKCPCFPAIPVTTDIEFFSKTVDAFFLERIVGHLMSIAQTRTPFHAWFDCSHQKRGPPCSQS
jgi:hypothetical protein